MCLLRPTANGSMLLSRWFTVSLKQLNMLRNEALLLDFEATSIEVLSSLQSGKMSTLFQTCFGLVVQRSLRKPLRVYNVTLSTVVSDMYGLIVTTSMEAPEVLFRISTGTPAILTDIITFSPSTSWLILSIH
jgi:hypothetical protein